MGEKQICSMTKLKLHPTTDVSARALRSAVGKLQDEIKHYKGENLIVEEICMETKELGEVCLVQPSVSKCEKSAGIAGILRDLADHSNGTKAVLAACVSMILVGTITRGRVGRVLAAGGATVPVALLLTMIFNHREVTKFWSEKSATVTDLWSKNNPFNK